MDKEDFYSQVYDVVQQIPVGRVTTYGAIAQLIGMPKSARMVGYAMNASHGNPQIPAHRVVNRNGMLTGKMHFSTVTEMEERLQAEGIQVQNDQIVDFEKLFWNPMDE